MRILSLNAWGGRLYERLIGYLEEVDPDVLCLQEVTRAPTGTAEWLVYRDGGLDIPQRANLLREVSAALPWHQAFFCPAARGHLYGEDGPVLCELGLATFVRATLPVIGQAQDFVHGEFAPGGWGEHPRPRNAHAVRLFDSRGPSTITVAHMHGLRDPSGKTDTPARHAQAKALVRLIRRVRREGETLVVCGDFNVLPGSATFDTLRRLDLVDLVTGRGHTDTRTSFYNKTPRFADYMLVTETAEIRRFDVVEEPEVSDHRPLLLDL